jgi:hypothetical protein
MGQMDFTRACLNRTVSDESHSTGLVGCSTFAQADRADLTVPPVQFNRAMRIDSRLSASSAFCHPPPSGAPTT